KIHNAPGYGEPRGLLSFIYLLREATAVAVSHAKQDSAWVVLHIADITQTSFFNFLQVARRPIVIVESSPVGIPDLLERSIQIVIVLDASPAGPYLGLFLSHPSAHSILVGQGHSVMGGGRQTSLAKRGGVVGVDYRRRLITE